MSREVVGALFYMFEGAAAEMVDGFSQTQDEDAVTKPPRGVGVLCDASFQWLSRKHHPDLASPPPAASLSSVSLASLTWLLTFLILAGAH